MRWAISILGRMLIAAVLVAPLAPAADAQATRSAEMTRDAGAPVSSQPGIIAPGASVQQPESSDQPPSAGKAPSRLKNWLLGAGIVVVLLVPLLLYLTRLSYRLGAAVVEVRDTTGSVTHVVQNMRRAARVAAVLLIIVPLVVLLGWLVRSAALVSLVPGLVAMNPVVASCFIALGGALWMMQQPSPRGLRAAQGIGVVVALLAAVKLAGVMIGVETYVDRLLFSDRLSFVPGLPPNRMAPNTALCLLLLGSAVALLDTPTRKGRRPAQGLAIAAALIALLALVGYLYSVTTLYHVTTFIPMALHTAAAVVTLALGVLFSRPETGMMAIVSSNTVGGVTARRLLPATILVPILLGWLRVLGQRLGLTDVDFGVSLVILIDIAFFSLLVWTTAGLLRRSDLDRQKTDAALSRERNLLRSLIDNVPDRIFIKDAGGHYVTDNAAHARFVGLSGPDQLMGKTVADFFPPEVAAKFAADDQAVIASGKPLLGREEPITEKDGTRRWVSTTKVPIRDGRGQPAGLVCISRDITEKVLAEEQLREQYTKLQELAKSEHKAHDTLKQAQSRMVQSEKLAGLGQLVAGVAHEINNPLSFVSNNVAVLQRDVAAVRKLLEMYQQADALVQSENPELMGNISELSERLDLPYTLSNLDELMVRSRDGLKRIQQIVKDLRDFARLDESDLHEIDVNQGVDSTVNIIRGRAKSKQVTIELDLQPLPPVACFPAKVNQVVMNLVANAIDACPANGKVTVRTCSVAAGVKIEVQDTGTGIEPAVRERIFDPFFTTKKQGEGTGLGLSISYGIVQDHGGTIEVDSTVGKGSRFTVTLPLRPAAPAKRGRGIADQD